MLKTIEILSAINPNLVSPKGGGNLQNLKKKRAALSKSLFIQTELIFK